VITNLTTSNLAQTILTHWTGLVFSSFDEAEGASDWRITGGKCVQ